MTRKELWKQIETLRAEVQRAEQDAVHHKHRHKRLMEFLRVRSPELFRLALEQDVKD